jgi:glutathione peroxidase
MWKSVGSLAVVAVLVISRAVSAADQAAEKASAKPAQALNFKVQSLEGKDVDLAQYRGKVVLVVNVASKCGLTPQYKELEALYKKYKGQGLVIVGFPCNQFNGQEPGTADQIRAFCTAKYDVTFPLMAKVEVKGDGACDLYKYLSALDAKPKGPGEISWNFEKFVIGRNGKVVGRFSPRTTPNAAEVVSLIESELEKK